MSKKFADRLIYDRLLHPRIKEVDKKNRLVFVRGWIITGYELRNIEHINKC